VPARPVTIHELEILDIREDEVDFRVVCSKGTYVRSLCRDIGVKLGTCGTMSALRRTRTGMCTITDSLPIEAVKEMDAAELEKYIVPMEKALAGYPRVDLNRQRGMDFLNGKTLADVPAPYKEVGLAEGAEADSPDGPDSTRYRVRVFGDERFLGMALYDSAEKNVKPHKVLAPEIREEWLGEAANGRV
jgi:tRNA pseudouridine55 synthase